MYTDFYLKVQSTQKFILMLFQTCMTCFLLWNLMNTMKVNGNQNTLVLQNNFYRVP